MGEGHGGEEGEWGKGKEGDGGMKRVKSGDVGEGSRDLGQAGCGEGSQPQSGGNQMRAAPQLQHGGIIVGDIHPPPAAALAHGQAGMVHAASAAGMPPASVSPGLFPGSGSAGSGGDLPAHTQQAQGSFPGASGGEGSGRVWG